MQEYRLEAFNNGKWSIIFEGVADANGLKQHLFPAQKAEKVRITITKHKGNVKIVEFGVYAV